MSKTFEKILESIVTDSNLGKEVDSLENFKEIYDVFKREGYEHDEQEFEKEMSELLKEFSKENLSESELDEIAGGKGNGSRFLASVLGGIAGLSSLSTPQSSAFDISDVKDTVSNVKSTVVTKAKQVGDFVKTNPLTVALASAGGAVVIGGTVVTGVALHKYLNNIERAIDKLEVSDTKTLKAIIQHILSLAKEDVLDKKFSTAAKDNKNLQELEKLGTKLFNKVKNLSDKTIVSEEDTVRGVLTKISNLGQKSDESVPSHHSPEISTVSSTASETPVRAVLETIQKDLEDDELPGGKKERIRALASAIDSLDTKINDKTLNSEDLNPIVNGIISLANEFEGSKEETKILDAAKNDKNLEAVIVLTNKLLKKLYRDTVEEGLGVETCELLDDIISKHMSIKNEYSVSDTIKILLSIGNFNLNEHLCIAEAAAAEAIAKKAVEAAEKAETEEEVEAAAEEAKKAVEAAEAAAKKAKEVGEAEAEKAAAVAESAAKKAVEAAAKKAKEVAAAAAATPPTKEQDKKTTKEQVVEKERLEKERLEKERLEKERLEKERLEKERLEKERLEKERLEKERLEKEKKKEEIRGCMSRKIQELDAETLKSKDLGPIVEDIVFLADGFDKSINFLISSSKDTNLSAMRMFTNDLLFKVYSETVSKRLKSDYVLVSDTLRPFSIIKTGSSLSDIINMLKNITNFDIDAHVKKMNELATKIKEGKLKTSQSENMPKPITISTGEENQILNPEDDQLPQQVVTSSVQGTQGSLKEEDKEEIKEEDKEEIKEEDKEEIKEEDKEEIKEEEKLVQRSETFQSSDNMSKPITISTGEENQILNPEGVQLLQQVDTSSVQEIQEPLEEMKTTTTKTKEQEKKEETEEEKKEEPKEEEKELIKHDTLYNVDDLIDIGNKILELFKFDDETIQTVKNAGQSIEWSKSKDDNYLLEQIHRYCGLVVMLTSDNKSILSKKQIEYIDKISKISNYADMSYTKSRTYRIISGINEALVLSSDKLQKVSVSIPSNSIFK